MKKNIFIIKGAKRQTLYGTVFFWDLLDKLWPILKQAPDGSVFTISERPVEYLDSIRRVS